MRDAVRTKYGDYRTIKLARIIDPDQIERKSA